MGNDRSVDSHRPKCSAGAGGAFLRVAPLQRLPRHVSRSSSSPQPDNLCSNPGLSGLGSQAVCDWASLDLMSSRLIRVAAFLLGANGVLCPRICSWTLSFLLCLGFCERGSSGQAWCAAAGHTPMGLLQQSALGFGGPPTLFCPPACGVVSPPHLNRHSILGLFRQPS